MLKIEKVYIHDESAAERLIRHAEYHMTNSRNTIAKLESRNAPEWKIKQYVAFYNYHWNIRLQAKQFLNQEI